MPFGYTGKILRVNLSTGAISVDEHDDAWYRRYVGGWGVVGYTLLNEVDPQADPLGPENKLIFTAGPLTGVPFVANDRNAVGAKSPLNGGWGIGEVGGWFGAELKHAGFDGAIFEGISPKPVYLWLHDGEAELRDASHLWGKGVKDTVGTLRTELGDNRVQVASIGPGGENMVLFSCIMNGLFDAAGRTGLGAVMGSKHLKAIAARGHKVPDVFDIEKVRELNKWFVQHTMDLNRGMWENGTAGGIPGLNAGSGLPTLNFQRGVFDKYMDIAGETVTKTILTDREACFACSVKCKRVVKTEAPYENDPAFGGPEYETTGALGSMLGIADMGAISVGNQLLNDASVDTIAAGTTIAFAYECYEKGIITKEDTGGLELTWGNADAMIALIKLIIKREGIGADLSLGSYRAAQKWGKGAIKYAMQVKKQEFPMHEPRFKQAQAIGYAVSPTGADHMHNLHDSGLEVEGKSINNYRIFGPFAPLALNDIGPNKVRALKYHTMWHVADNCLTICCFPAWTEQQLVDLTNAITGWNTSVYELEMLGERAWTMARAWNTLCGFTVADDTLPERMFEPFQEGPRKGTAVSKRDWEEGKRIYYGMLGWNQETGVPLRWKLQELDIEWAADMLDKAGK